VELEGDQLLVGAPFGLAGRAVAFRRINDRWEPNHILDPPLTENRPYAFGHRLSGKGDVALVHQWGFKGVDGIPVDRGAVHVYRFDGSSWRHTGRRLEDGTGTSSLFGEDFEFDGVTALVGAPHHLANVGATYFFGL
jgi:hypothetical protein